MLVLLITLSILCSFIFSWLNLKKYCFLVRRSYYWLLSVIILFFFEICGQPLFWKFTMTSSKPSDFLHAMRLPNPLNYKSQFRICPVFDTNFLLEIKKFFSWNVNMSKTFNIIWLEGHLQKLRSLGLCGKYLYRGTIKKGVLISHPSNLSAIKTCIPRGLMSGPSFFLVCINGTPNELT